MRNAVITKFSKLYHICGGNTISNLDAFMHEGEGAVNSNNSLLTYYELKI